MKVMAQSAALPPYYGPLLVSSSDRSHNSQTRFLTGTRWLIPEKEAARSVIQLAASSMALYAVKVDR